MKDIPFYSEEARDVLDLFYQDYVTAIFYFEDSEHESFYERLLQRLIPNLRPFQVICLGGKAKIISKAKESHVSEVRRIFVLDKDFDDLLGSVFSRGGVYYLRSFSVENYLVDLLAILRTAVELNARQLTVTAAHQKCIAFPAFLVRLHSRLLEVARLFVVARKFRVSIQTTKMSIDDLLSGSDPDEPMPTEDWIENYRQRLVQSTLGDNEWLSDVSALQGALSNAFVRPEGVDFPQVENVAHICGKHLWGCVIRYVQRAVGVKLLDLDGVELYLRVVGNINLAKLGYLKASILNDYPELVNK